MLAQLNGQCIQRKVFLPTTIKSHVVKIAITWSISPDENNNIGLVYCVQNTENLDSFNKPRIGYGKCHSQVKACEMFTKHRKLEPSRT